MNLEEEMRRAGEARQMLDAPLFQQARKVIEEQMALARQRVPIDNTLMHTRLILMEQVAQSFFGYFEQIAQTGKLAQFELDQQEQKQRSFAERILSFRSAGRSAI